MTPSRTVLQHLGLLPLLRGIVLQLYERTVTVKDGEIERQLTAHAGDITLKQTAIKARQQLILEYRSEHEQIQKAAGHFGLFLKKHSITPCNDATLAYLDHLIEEEQAKVEAGGNRKRLRALQEDRQKHEEIIKVLTQNMANGANHQLPDEEGVDRLVKRLYNLKHFGKNLRIVKQNITAAHQTTYREMPYRINSRASGRWTPFLGIFQTASRPSHSTTMRNQVAVQGTFNTAYPASP